MTTAAASLASVTLTGVRASAGSGKTYSLTTEYLRMLFAGADAESILATTFTRTAAAEILGRIFQRLAKAAQDPDALRTLATDLGEPGLDQASVQAQLRRFCRSLDRVSIGTIDSFFSAIAGCYRLECPGTWEGEVCDETSVRAARLRLEALGNVLARTDRESFLATLDRLRADAASRSVVRRLDSELGHLLEIFESAEPSCWELPDVPDPVSEEAVSAAVKQVKALAAVVDSKHHANAMQKALEQIADEQWSEFIAKGLAPKILAGDLIYNRKPISEAVQLAYAPLIAQAKALLLAELAAKSLALRRFLGAVAPEFSRLRRLRGMSFYSDVPSALSRLAGDMAIDDAAYRMDRRLDHVLLDEFQDTDPRQWAILKPFASAIYGSRRGGSVFWVGDVKQAIYGWRGASASILGNLDSEFAGIRWRDLSRSYRSSPVVLGAVNRVFEKLDERCDAIPSDVRAAVADWTKGYIPHEAANRDLPGYVAVTESPADDDDGAGDGDDDDGPARAGQPGTPHIRFAAARVARLVAEHPGRSLAVLTRKNDTADAILFQLRRLNVAASALGGASLTSDPASALVLAALTLADRPADGFAAFRVLNSPLADVLGLDDLSTVAVNSCAGKIRRALCDGGYAATVMAWAQAIGSRCSPAGADRLAFLVELADQFDRRPRCRPRDFIDVALDSHFADRDPSPVQVMTIHKAKGLEYDIVVLPELHSALFCNTPAVLTDIEPETHATTRICAYASETVRALHPDLARMYARWREAEMREALCLLYVALTRARYALHIVSPPETRKSFTLMSVVRSQLCGAPPRERADGGKTLYESGDALWSAHFAPDPVVQPVSAAPPEERASAAAPVPARLRRRRPPSSVENWGSVGIRTLIGAENRQMRLEGKALHAMLQQIGWIDDGAPGDEALCSAALKACPELSEQALRNLAATLNRQIQRPSLRASLARPELASGETVELSRESLFSVMVDGEYLTGVFDRVHVVLRDGQPVRADVFDFKTGPVSIESLQSEIARYSGQMRAYEQALARRLGVPRENVSAKLVFTSLGAVAAIPG